MQKMSLWGLWVLVPAILAISVYQPLSGHWVAFFLLWPGFPSMEQLGGLLAALASVHRVLGFVTGALSVPILAFGFFSGPSRWVRVFAVVGFVMVFITVLGGYIYVTSVFKDRWSLGQMADASVGVFGAYFLQLIFMARGPQFPWSRSHA